jgi:hypothetical protein
MKLRVTMLFVDVARYLFLVVSLLASTSFAFTVKNPLVRCCEAPLSFHATKTTTSSRRSSRLYQSSSRDTTDKKFSLIVISPPGGVGEVSAVKAASMGASVRWFVVSPSSSVSSRGGSSLQTVVLSQQALDQIQATGGVVELAGADAASLLLSPDDVQSAVPAVSAWCGTANADAIICTFDGATAKVLVEIMNGGEVNPYATKDDGDDDPLQVWKDAIKVAARQASLSIRKNNGGDSRGKKVAILSLEEGIELDDGEEENNENGGAGAAIGNLVGGLLLGGGSKVKVPATLVSAMGSGDDNIVTLRHGALFGTPESSPDFSALKGGPRKQAELCEEYVTRTVRVDPSRSMSGNYALMGKTTRTSRHAVGEAAAYLALNRIPITTPGLDISISSQRGIDPPTLDTWLVELDRVNQALESGGAGAQQPLLFSADFGSVPDIGRLTGWLATKWAPTVLRTYDIAAIRKGARPVYANKIADDQVEIVWQELNPSDFQTVTAGRMIVQVSNTGLVARRGPPGGGGDKGGFGEISRKPLQGEDVLVRRLAEAASQAIEKGLANKVWGIHCVFL